MRPIWTLVAALAAAWLGLTASPARSQDEASNADEPVVEETTVEEPIVHVLMTTTKGEITLALNAELAPKTVANFLRYTDDAFYAGTVFHRVIDGFMIQGGGFTVDGQQKRTNPPIENEGRNGLKNQRGTIAMARTGDPNSATAQFYINVQDNPNLDTRPTGPMGYAVFGRVVKGMDVVDAIRVVQVRNRRVPGGVMENWPAEEVVIQAVRRLTPEEVEALEHELGADDPQASGG